MRISGVQIDRFGIWSGVQFENLSEGVNVFYGPNEAGKTTLMQFIRMVLYGFGGDRAERYLRTSGYGMLSAGNRVGGSLAIATHDDEYHVRRCASAINPMQELQGELRVTTRDGSRQGAHRLTTLLTGIDELIFNNVYAVGLREMQYLGTLNDTQASRYLYNLSTGTDRVSLVDVMRQLQTTRRNLVGGDEEPSLLEEMNEQRNRHVAEIGQFAGNVEQWAHYKNELGHLDDEVGRIESGQTAHARRIRTLELAARVQPIWNQRQKVELELESLGHVPVVTPATRSQIDELTRQLESRTARLDELRQQRESLEAPGDKQEVDDEAFVRNALRVEALLDQRSTIMALDDQLQSLQSRLEETEFEVQAELERLGLASAGESPPQFDDQTIELLREPARQVERDRELLEQVKQDGARLREESEKIGRELSEALGRDPDFSDRGGGQELDVTRDTGEIANHLRRRMALESKLKQLREKLEDMDNRRRAILRSQLLPWEVIQALGALFSLGSLLLLAALFGESLGIIDQARTGMAIMGTIAVAVAALLKVLLDGSSRDELLGIQEQTDTLGREFESAEREASKLERLIPGRRTGPFTLGEAQKRLTRLESLLPLDSRRRALKEGGTKYEQRAIEIANRLKNSRQRWTETLETAGLSKRLTPAQVLQMAGEAGQLARLNRECEALREQIADNERELEVFGERAADLLVDVGIRSSSRRVVDRINQLTTGLRVHEQHRELAQKRLSSKRQLRDREQELGRELRQLESQRRALVSAQGAVDDDDLQRLLERREKWEALKAQRDSLTDEIKKMLGDQQAERSVTSELFGNNKTPLDERLKKAVDERKRMDARLKELLSRRGELVEKSRALAGDRQLATSLLNVGIIEAQIDGGVEQAKIIAAMTSLLRTVYKRYENDRQPETLKEASDHLRRMTGGKYTRIWTPLDQDVLFVDDPNRLSIPVDQLSRGTREQLFLALRLALVSGYARRGIKIPVVLDDVLVNFDVERTRAAAEVLVEFGHAGNQVLIFSCHQHVMEIFAALNADVRTLPGYELPVPIAESVATAPIPTAVWPAAADMQSARQHLPRSQPRPTPTDELAAEQLPTEFTIGYEDEAWEERPFGFDQEVEYAAEVAAAPNGKWVPTESEFARRSAVERQQLSDRESDRMDDWDDDGSGYVPNSSAGDRESRDLWEDADEEDLRDAPFDRTLTPLASSLSADPAKARTLPPTELLDAADQHAPLPAAEVRFDAVDGPPQRGPTRRSRDPQTAGSASTATSLPSRSAPLGEPVSDAGVDEVSWDVGETETPSSAGLVADTVITGDAARRGTQRQAAIEPPSSGNLQTGSPSSDLDNEIMEPADDSLALEDDIDRLAADSGEEEYEYEYEQHKPDAVVDGRATETTSDRDEARLLDSDPIELDAADASNADAIADTDIDADDVEYEYIEVDEDDDDPDIEVVDGDEEAEREDVEYEYIEVDADDGPAVGDDVEYEYIDDDDEQDDDDEHDDDEHEDGDEVEDASAEVAYEYEYVDADDVEGDDVEGDDVEGDDVEGDEEEEEDA